ncbi:MAG: sulfite exporter TauE/SafE family protein [Candidatus Aminicenantes bacterium]
MEYVQLLMLFGVGAVAGFINVNAGGGSSLTLPALIFMGLDGALANGTNRVAIFIQNIFAVASFHKDKMHQYKRSSQLAVFTLPGAVVGALLAVTISSALFERILGVVLILIVFSLFLSRSYQSERTGQERHTSRFIYPLLLVIGFYGGFLQIGVGFLFMASLYHLLNLDLVRVNMHKVFIILIYTLPALLIFLLTGNVNWKFGLALAAGNSLGAWWGAHAAVKGGEKIIRMVLAVAIVIMAFKFLASTELIPFPSF